MKLKGIFAVIFRFFFIEKNTLWLRLGDWDGDSTYSWEFGAKSSCAKSMLEPEENSSPLTLDSSLGLSLTTLAIVHNPSHAGPDDCSKSSREQSSSYRQLLHHSVGQMQITITGLSSLHNPGSITYFPRGKKNGIHFYLLGSPHPST